MGGGYRIAGERQTMDSPEVGGEEVDACHCTQNCPTARAFRVAEHEEDQAGRYAAEPEAAPEAQKTQAVAGQGAHHGNPAPLGRRERSSADEEDGHGHGIAAAYSSVQTGEAGAEAALDEEADRHAAI